MSQILDRLSSGTVVTKCFKAWPLVVVFVWGCQMEPEKTPQGQVGLIFAQALTAGEFPRAHGLLSAKLRAQIAARELEAKFKEMIAYGDGPVTLVQVMNVLDNWPAKQPGDLGWAYVALAGDSYSEAVTVVVAREGERLVVRDIEWGRP